MREEEYTADCSGSHRWVPLCLYLSVLSLHDFVKLLRLLLSPHSRVLVFFCRIEAWMNRHVSRDQLLYCSCLISLLYIVYWTPTCSKGEEEALVRVLLQQGLDPLPHPLIPLVDELLSKVAVYFPGGHLFAGWECHIIEVRDLGLKRFSQAMKVKGGEKPEILKITFSKFAPLCCQITNVCIWTEVPHEREKQTIRIKGGEGSEVKGHVTRTLQ